MKTLRNSLIILSVVIFIVAVFATGISAEYENRFVDVEKGAWYYDAVSSCVEKGIFTGVTETTFKPDDGMTRAMFVTTLAKLLDIDVSSYTEVSFDDVVAGSWYAPYVEWAYREEITKGVGNNCFGVDDTITRQQMVTLFYNTAVKYGEDVSVTNDHKYRYSADKSSIADWAEDAMKWALSESIVSGTGNKGTLAILSPDGTATRAQAAKIILSYIEFLAKDEPYVTNFTINGNPIEYYTIVYSATPPKSSCVKDAAKNLKAYIENACGVSMPIVTDDSEPTGFEIIIGKTNREDQNIVFADRDGKDVSSFEIRVIGNNLLIAGKSDEDGRDGSEFGVYAFAREILGMGFYTKDVVTYTRINKLDLPEGYEYKDSPGFESRAVFWSGVAEENSTGEPFHGTGNVHNLGDLTETSVGGLGPDPCLTDPVILETAIKNVRAKLDAKKNVEAIWISQNDTTIGCMCDNCMDVYREEGSRAGTLMRFLNAIAKDLETDYPHVYIWTLAYHHTTIPVVSQLDENIIVYYCTLDNCASHPYNDPACGLNKSVYNNLVGWSKVCSKMYVWDYSTNFTYTLSAFPIMTSMLENKNWFYDLGVVGEFNNAVSGTHGEFGLLKAHMVSKLQWDPDMSKEAYNEEIDAFLKAYYGNGWTYLRKYIDITERISDNNHFGYYTAPYSIMSDEEILAFEKEFTGYWDAAEAGCSNATELERVQRARLSWTFTLQNARYQRDYVNGTPESRADFMSDNTIFYEASKDVIWSEKGKDVVFDSAKAPYFWIQ